MASTKLHTREEEFISPKGNWRQSRQYNLEKMSKHIAKLLEFLFVHVFFLLLSLTCQISFVSPICLDSLLCGVTVCLLFFSAQESQHLNRGSFESKINNTQTLVISDLFYFYYKSKELWHCYINVGETYFWCKSYKWQTL